MVTNSPTVTPQTLTSFFTDDLAQLATLLEAEGYTPLKPLQKEYARLRHASGALCVLFDSGSVICQGRDTGDLLTLLRSLVAETEIAL